MPLRVDPATGFLESVSPGHITFDAQKKVLLLKMATDAVNQKKLPNLSGICDVLGIKSKTFYRHLKEDPVFAEGWNEVKVRIDSVFGQEVAVKALSPNGTLALLALLRKNETGSWTGNWGAIPAGHGEPTKALASHFNEVVDAEIVPEKNENNGESSAK